MAAFSGTQTKCKSCGKTAYPMEQIVAESVIFHKGCFRCSHCKCTLKLNNFVSLEGVFYCKAHFEQLFTATGSYSKSFDEAIKSEKENPPPPESLTVSSTISRFNTEKKEVNPLASRFGGTQDKCLVCGKTVYPLEKISLENAAYHNTCFRCTHCGCTLNIASFKTHQGKLYCQHHHNQLFLKKGNFSGLQDEGQPQAAERPVTERKKEEEEEDDDGEDVKPTSAPPPLPSLASTAPTTPVFKAAAPSPAQPKKDENKDDEDDDEDD